MADRRDTDDLLGLVDRAYAEVVRLRDENARLRGVAPVAAVPVGADHPEVEPPAEAIAEPEPPPVGPDVPESPPAVEGAVDAAAGSVGPANDGGEPAVETAGTTADVSGPGQPDDATPVPAAAPATSSTATSVDERPPLAAFSTSPPPRVVADAPVLRRSPEELVRVFRSLFRGRDDVYAIPRIAADGSPGFAEARVRASDGREDRLPLTDGVIRNHLGGRRTIGIYPLLEDGTCWFVALELAGAGWRPRAAAICSACRDLEIDVAVERVSTGTGARAWMFFESHVPAARARAVAHDVLERARERGLSDPGAVRIHPDADVSGDGAPGTAIALPLDRDPVSEEHSQFLDERFQPFPDQWAALSMFRRIPTGRLSGGGGGLGISDTASNPDHAGVPSGESPVHDVVVRVLRSNVLLVDVGRTAPGVRAGVTRLAGIFAPPRDPCSDGADALPFDPAAPDADGRIAVARGGWDDLLGLVERAGCHADVEDARVDGTPLAARFEGETRPQIDAALAVATRHDSCVVSAGATADLYTLAAQMIATRGRATLVLVRRRRDLDAWQDALARRLGLATASVGLVGDGKDRRTGIVDVAVAASAVRGSEVKPWALEYGHVIVDGCHRIGNATLTRLLSTIRPRFLLGLTTKSSAAGGLDLLAATQFAPHVIEVAPVARAGGQAVIVRATGFETDASDVDTEHRQLIAALAIDARRNDFVAREVAALAMSGLRPLVLTERTDHARELTERIERIVPASGRLASEAGRRQRALTLARLKELPDEVPWALVASTRFAIDGLGTNRIGALVLAMPYPFRGDFERVLGHIWRRYGTRGAIKVYDFVDASVPALVRMYWRRRAGYVALGAAIESEPELPALRAIAARRGLPA